MTPMFPLESVLVPGMVLPLHVFEPRYRALVRDCLAGERRFGVVLIERGSEVGGGDVRFDFGTASTVVGAEELPDGRWELEAIGGDRVRVLEWLPDDPYPIAEVERLVEPPWSADDDGAHAGVVAAFDNIVDLAARLGAVVDPRVTDLPGDPAWDGWLVAARAPIGDLDKLALLSAATVADRLQTLRSQLEDVAGVLASRLSGG